MNRKIKHHVVARDRETGAVREFIFYGEATDFMVEELHPQILPQTLARVLMSRDEFDAWVKENPDLKKMVVLIEKGEDGIYRNVNQKA